MRKTASQAGAQPTEVQREFKLPEPGIVPDTTTKGHRCGPNPQLKKRPTGSGHLGRYSLRLTVGGRRVVFSMLTDSYEIAKTRRLKVLPMVKAGANEAAIRAWLAAEAPDEIERLIAAQIVRRAKPGEPNVGLIIDLYVQFQLPTYGTTLSPQRRAQQTRAFFKAARTALEYKLRHSLPPRQKISDATLREVPLSWLDHNVVGLNTRAAHTLPKGRLREAMLSRNANYHYALRGMFTGDFRDHLIGNGVILPPGFLNLLDRPARRPKPQDYRPLPSNELGKLGRRLEKAACDGLLSWIIVVTLFGGVGAKELKEAGPAWLKEKGFLQMPGCKPVPLPIGIWRWLRRQRPFQPRSLPFKPTELRCQRTVACELLRHLKIATWQKDPLTQLRIFARCRLLSVMKQSVAVLDALKIRSADRFEKFYGDDRYSPKILSKIDRLAKTLGHRARAKKK